MSTPTLAPPTLTHADRCDRCGAQAKVKATFVTGDLLFCGHHGAVYLDKLVLSATAILDEGIVR